MCPLYLHPGFNQHVAVSTRRVEVPLFIPFQSFQPATYKTDPHAKFFNVKS
jgi:hypothetical protein